MRQFVKKNRIHIWLIVAFLIVGILYLSRINPSIQGDGKEYILQAISFRNHLSFGVTALDLADAQKEFYTVADDLERVYNMDNPMHPYKGARYSNHYGSYSALVMPVMCVLETFNIYPLWSFSITNLILWLSALLVILFYLKASSCVKLCVLLLSIINPIAYYLQWSHSEMYIYAFIVIGLVFFYNKQYGRAILFISVAASQNLGVIPFAIMVGIDFIIQCIIDYKNNNEIFMVKGFLKNYWYRIIPYGLFYIPGLMPIVSTYMKFHTINLVKDVAMEHNYLFSKAMNYLFDLNLGIFPYEPIILILFIVMLVIGLKKNLRVSLINLIGVGGMLYVVSNQIQINCGMQQIMRYNSWIIPIMIFFVVMNWNTIFPAKKRALFIALGIQVTFLLALLSYTMLGSGSFGYLEFAPWTKSVLDKYPQLYNPTHGIFYSRASHIETYYSPNPVIYTNSNGNVRKILLSKEAEDVFYSDDFQLTDRDGRNIDKTTLSTTAIDKGDYKYVNMTGEYIIAPKYDLGDIIYFDNGANNADPYFLFGLSYAEEWGRWTDGNEVHGLFNINNKGIFAEELLVSLEVGSVFYQPQETIIAINGCEVYHETIENEKLIQFSIDYPKTNIIELEIRIPNSTRPSDIMDSRDNRDLGLGLITLSISNLNAH